MKIQSLFAVMALSVAAQVAQAANVLLFDQAGALKQSAIVEGYGELRIGFRFEGASVIEVTGQCVSQGVDEALAGQLEPELLADIYIARAVHTGGKKGDRVVVCKMSSSNPIWTAGTKDQYLPFIIRPSKFKDVDEGSNAEHDVVIYHRKDSVVAVTFD